MNKTTNQQQNPQKTIKPEDLPLDEAQLEQISGGMSGVRSASAGSGNSNDVVLSDKELDKVSGGGSGAGGG